MTARVGFRRQCTFSANKSAVKYLSGTAQSEWQDTLEAVAVMDLDVGPTEILFSQWFPIFARAFSYVPIENPDIKTVLCLLLCARKILSCPFVAQFGDTLCHLERLDPSVDLFGSQPFTFPIVFAPVPDISKALMFVNFLRNNMTIKLNSRDILLWGMYFAAVELGLKDSPYITSIEDRDPEWTNGFKDRFMEIAIVRYLYCQLFAPLIRTQEPWQSSLERTCSLSGNADDSAVKESLAIFSLLECEFDVSQILDHVQTMSMLKAILITMINPRFSQLTVEHVRQLVNHDFESNMSLARILLVLCFGIVTRTSSADAFFDEFMADPPPKWATLIKSEILVDPLTNERLALASQGSVSAARALVKEGFPSLQLLDTSFPLHKIIHAVVARERFELTGVNIFTQLELYWRHVEKETLNEEDALPLLTESYKILQAQVGEWAGKDQNVAELIWAGCVPPGNISYCCLDEPSLLVVDPEKDLWVIAANIAWLCLPVRTTTDVSEMRLDFLTCAVINPTFKLSLERDDDKEAIQQNRKRHWDCAMTAKKPKVLAPILSNGVRDSDLLPVIAEYITRTSAAWIFTRVMQTNQQLVTYFTDRADFLSAYFQSLFKCEAKKIGKSLNSMLAINDPKVNRVVYRYLAEYAFQDPAAASSIFHRLRKYSCCASSILERVASQEQVYTQPFVTFLKEVVDLLPKRPYVSDSPVEIVPPLQSAWSEDPVTENTPSEFLSLWNEPVEEELKPCTCSTSEQRFIRQHVFHCYTCDLAGNMGCCSSCALRCHKGHDVVYAGVYDFACDCSESGACQFVREGEGRRRMRFGRGARYGVEAGIAALRGDAPPDPFTPMGLAMDIGEDLPLDANIDHEAILSHLAGRHLGPLRNAVRRLREARGRHTRPSVMRRGADMFASLFTEGDLMPRNADVIKQNPKPICEPQDPISVTVARNIIMRLYSVPPLAGYDVQKRLSTDILAYSLSNLPRCEQAQDFHFSRTNLRIMRILPGPILPTCLVDVGGPDRNIVIVGDGQSVSTFDLQTMERMNSERMNMEPITNLAVYPDDPSIVAIASISEVVIYRVSNAGRLERRHHLEYLFGGNPNRLCVTGIEWVSTGRMHLAVTTSGFVKIYDIPNDCISPLACMMSMEKITSSCFVTHDENIYCVVGTASGHVAVQACGEALTGPVHFSKFVSFATQGSDPCHVSVSKQTNIFFVSRESGLVTLCRIGAIFGPSVLTESSTVDLKSKKIRLEFVSCYPNNPAVHFLHDMASGSMYSIEITDEGISTNTVHLRTKMKGLKCVYAGQFQRGPTLSIVVGDGYVYEIKPGKSHGSMTIAFEATQPEKASSDEDPYSVPLSFWTKLEAKPEITALKDRKGYDLSHMLHDKRQVFGRPLELVASVSDRSYAIAGVVIGCEHLPPEKVPTRIKVGNRVFTNPEKKARTWNFPLKPEEVVPGQPITIEISGDGPRTAVQNISILLTNLHESRSEESTDWKDQPRRLSDVSDPSVGKAEVCVNEVNFIQGALSGAEFIQNRPEDREAVNGLISTIYTDPSISMVCRRIVLKAYGTHPDLERMWCDVLGGLCLGKSVPKESMPLVFRDYSLLNEELQKEISGAVWSVGEVSGVHALISAF